MKFEKEDKLKAVWTFEEFTNYMRKTKQLPEEYFEELDLVMKGLMPKLLLKNNSIILESTPFTKKGYFYKLMNK